MSHLHRFFVSPDSLGVGEVSLPPEEAHHALKVARVREGDRIGVFDGAGREGIGKAVVAGSKAVSVSVETVEETARSAREVTLGQAWLNREKNMEGIVTRGVELGVSRFVFFRGEHSERAPRVSDKFRRLAIEACKQTGRVWLPEFVVADDLSTLIEGAKGCILIATMDCDGISLAEALADHAETLYVVGPEGDFSVSEVERALAAGAIPMSLGDYTLRSEVAVEVGLTLIQHYLGNLG